PRKPGHEGDVGRGPLPATAGRFDGVEVTGATAILHYHAGATAVREWFESHQSGQDTVIYRHFEVEPHLGPLIFSVGAAGSTEWVVRNPRTIIAESAKLVIATNSPSFTLQVQHGELVANLAASSTAQRVSLAIGCSSGTSAGLLSQLENKNFPTPSAPALNKQPRWPEIATTRGTLNSVSHDGLTLDRIEL